MDEDETYEVQTVQPLRHDRWSILIVGLNYMTKLTDVTAGTLGQFTVMAAQHANQVIYDKKFGALTEPLKNWGE